MIYEIEVEYTSRDVTNASKRYLRKLVGLDFMVAWFLCLAMMVVLIINGDRSWVVGVLGSILILSVIIISTICIVIFRRNHSVLKMMEKSVAQFVFNEDGITSRSELGCGTTKWKTINKLWCFPEVWLLVVAKGVYSTIPTKYLSQELQDFIVKKVKETGGDVYIKFGGQGSGHAHSGGV